MSPEMLASMSNADIVGMLMSLQPSDEAVALLAAAITDEHWIDGANELRQRFTSGRPAPVIDDGKRHNRMRPANSVEIDPDRFRHYFWMRRMTLTSVSRLINRTDAWASVIVSKRQAGYWALDELATELSVHVNDLIFAIGSDAERERSFG